MSPWGPQSYSNERLETSWFLQLKWRQMNSFFYDVTENFAFM